MRASIILGLGAGLAASYLAGTMAHGQSAPTAAKAEPAQVEAYVTDTWSRVPEEWKARFTQDDTQKACSLHRNAPPKAEFDAIVAREKASVVLPADGQVLGNWQEGRKIAQSGQGGQFTDNADTFRGGNCYACHQMSPQELSFGTLGPSLLAYGRIRKFAPEEARAAYAKIFNSQAVQPCSGMPRFGQQKFLSEQQIKDAVAYLFDPDSPVNK